MAAPSHIAILAAEESEGGVDLLLPAVPELIGGIIAFLIVFFFIWKVAGPRVGTLLDERSKAIAGKLDEAETAKSEAEQLRADYQAQVAEAKAQATEILEQARRDAENVRAELVSRAEQEAAELVSRAREEAQNEKARALADARQEMANLSIDLAERVVGESLDRDAQAGLVERYLADLERM